ncbi:NADPH:quinone oxidoreductase family protein [Nitratireductor pacificus]|uniref:Alcohol dehydrogenase n=1 Tax=Nitratireductor pacificus pht-3B TaxID=391937 RepID=K2MQJ9_9HYPH|nr:NADPH:quinone oxidoreductase family protein [Nitratireductor pacificus]EKF19582.1 alcohol dehydrogenase [Nitratireductor pacificus pht-3B]
MTAGARKWVSGQQGLGNLAIEGFAPPEPGPGELCVAVAAAALNFSDLLMIDDKYQVKPPRPFTPGQEVAGIVRAAGAGTRHKPGDRVTGKVDWGGFATHAIMRDTMAIPMPSNVSFAEGAALPVVYTTAYVALTESTDTRAGETVLVHAAAGGVGLAAVQIAAARGARVIAAAGSEAKRALAVANGAFGAIDPGEPGWSKTCKVLTEGRSVDVVVDPVGGDATLESLRALAEGGRLLIVGFASGTIPQIPANRLLLKRASAIGVYWNHETDAEMLARVTQRMSDDLASGAIRPVIDRREGLESLPQALADLGARRTSGKVVINIEDM